MKELTVFPHTSNKKYKIKIVKYNTKMYQILQIHLVKDTQDCSTEN